MSPPRSFGLLPATALNFAMIVGAGVFGSVPLMQAELPGPWAISGWLLAGLLVLLDGLVWCELGAMMPGSGGSTLFLRECYGPHRWGRLMSFLFVWQFLLSGPLEIASGLVLLGQFSTALDPSWNDFNLAHTVTWNVWPAQNLAISIGPTRILGLAVGALTIALLYRRIDNLKALTVGVGVAVFAIIAALLVVGAGHFDPARAFGYPPPPTDGPIDFADKLGKCMILAIYSYLGYYNVCYIGDEVRDPGRTIPRSILLSAGLVVVLFTALHLALLGGMTMPPDRKTLETINLPAEFLRGLYGNWAAAMLTAVLIGSCFGSVYAALLGYSRVPYGAARQGHFLAGFGVPHPTRQFPHRGLLLIGGLTLFWSLFDLQNIINAFIATRILEQFAAQIVGLVVLRRTQPERPRPFRVWLYPLPCGLALVGWLYLYVSAGLFAISFGLATLAAGAGAFLAWAWWGRRWPFRGEPGA